MALPVWGNLEKSQIDAEKIEEAIARLIQAHEDDSDAHIEAGESLQSHKAAEIIDHVVASIIADKIKDKEITIKKLFEDKYIFHSSFESLDGWDSDFLGISSRLMIGGGSCQFIAGDDINDFVNLKLEGLYQSIDYRKDPWFQALVEMPSPGDIFDFAIMAGEVDYDDTPTNCFGFKWIAADEKFYAYSWVGAVEEKTEIVSYDPATQHSLRAELSLTGTIVKFYIDGVLVATHDTGTIYVEAENLLTFVFKKKGLGGAGDFLVRNVIFSQDW